MKRKLARTTALAMALGLLASCGGDEKNPEDDSPGFGKTNTKKTPGSDESGKTKGGGKGAVAAKGEGKAGGAKGGRRSFEESDQNGDGFITEDEAGELAWLALAKADADGDGKISQEERSTLRGGGNARPEPSEMIDLLDKDGDGLIAIDEMTEQMRGRLADADTDGDGKVSLEEIEANRAARGGGGIRPGGRRPGSGSGAGGRRPPGGVKGGARPGGTGGGGNGTGGGNPPL